jgi:hypothetical protein
MAPLGRANSTGGLPGPVARRYRSQRQAGGCDVHAMQQRHRPALVAPPPSGAAIATAQL